MGGVCLRAFWDPLVRLLARGLAPLVVRRVRQQMLAFDRATHIPALVQKTLLRTIVQYQAGTTFGRDHRFAAILNVEDYRRHVPVTTYEYHQPYIERLRRGEWESLLADGPPLMFAMTSGTTAERKYIPVTRQYLRNCQRAWSLWGLRTYQDHPNIWLQPIVQLSSNWDEFRTPGGTPCGSVSGLTATMQKRLARWLYCVPPSVEEIKDPLAKHYVVLRFSMDRPVGMVVAANPSTLIQLAQVGNREKEWLLRDLHDGTLNPQVNVPSRVRVALRSRLTGNRGRARELEAIAERTGTLYPRDYWPAHCLLGNWTGGTVGAYLRHYPRYFGDMPVRDIGLIASEGRFTIPFQDDTPAGVLDITSHFFEFIPEKEGESTQPAVLGVEDLEVGRNYFIVPTTCHGLYRYHIHDIIRVVGMYNNTPMVEFLSKGSHFVNVTGEKLSEHQVAAAVDEVLERMNLALTACSLAPCWDQEVPYYGFFVERDDLLDQAQASSLAGLIDRCLYRINMEYASKRDSLRLGPVQVKFLRRGTWQEWDRRRLQQKGGTPEQYKHPLLVNDLEFANAITDWNGALMLRDSPKFLDDDLK